MRFCSVGYAEPSAGVGMKINHPKYWASVVSLGSWKRQTTLEHCMAAYTNASRKSKTLWHRDKHIVSGFDFESFPNVSVADRFKEDLHQVRENQSIIAVKLAMACSTWFSCLYTFPWLRWGRLSQVFAVSCCATLTWKLSPIGCLQRFKEAHSSPNSGSRDPPHLNSDLATRHHKYLVLDDLLEDLGTIFLSTTFR